MCTEQVANAAPSSVTNAANYTTGNKPAPTNPTDDAPANREEQTRLLALRQSFYDDAVIRAFDAYSQGRFDDADESAGDAIQVALKSLVVDEGWRAYFIDGLALHWKGSEEKAAKQLQNALRRAPDDQRETVAAALRTITEKSDVKAGPQTPVVDAAWQPQPPLVQHVNAPGAVAFSPDGSILATGSWKNSGTTQISEIVLWNTEDDRVRRSIEGRWQFVWNGKGPKPPWVGHFGKINTLAFSPDGRSLASGGEDGRVTLWNVLNGDPLKLLDKTESPVVGISWADANSVTVISRDGTVNLWSPATAQKQRSFHLAAPNSGNWIRVNALSRDGSRLATGDSTGNITIWELPTGRLLRRFQNSLSQDLDQPLGVEATAMAFSPDNKILISANHAHVYMNMVEKMGGNESSNPKIYYAGQRVGQLEFSPDGLSVFVVCDTKVDTLMLPDARSPLSNAVIVANFPWSGSPIRALDLSPQGSYIAGGAANGTVVLWR